MMKPGRARAGQLAARPCTIDVAVAVRHHLERGMITVGI